MSSSARSGPSGLELLSICIPVLLLGWHASSYLPFFCDDGFISLRYSERLLAGQGLTWTEGEAVEGYSNLLWVLSCALLGAMGLDLILAARIVGVVSMALVFVAVHRLGSRIDPTRIGGALSANLVLAALGTCAVWAIGGLEEGLYAALLALAWVEISALLTDDTLTTPPAARAGVLLGLACWTRPDGPLFVALATVALVARGARADRSAWLRTLALTTGVPAAMVLAQLGFRLLYYEDWLPNPARIKGSLTVDRFWLGLRYVRGVVHSYAPMVLLVVPSLAVLGGPNAGRSRTLAAFFGANALAWAAYVVSIGGDIFPAHRHGLVMAVAIAFVIVVGFSQWPPSRLARGAWTGLLVVTLASLAFLQPKVGVNRRAKSERWEWDGEVLARVLAQAPAARPPLLAVTAAGTLPYFSKLPSIDMLGLNDRTIARLPARGTRLAHDHGDGDYVLSREPDVIVFNIGTGPAYVYKQDFGVRRSAFRRSYVRVPLQGYAPYPHRGDIYIRRRGVLGIHATDRVLRIPGYLVPGTVAELDAQGRLIGRVEPWSPRAGEPFTFRLPEGHWRATLPSGVDVTIEGALPSSLDCPDVTIEGPVTVRLAMRSEVSWLVDAITFERTRAPEDVQATTSAHCEARVGLGAEVVAVAALDRWTFEGLAFAANPRTDPGRQRRLTGFEGPFVSSHHPQLGASATGQAWSPAFEVPPHSVLSVRVAGGHHLRAVGLRLWSDGRLVRGYAPPTPTAAFHDVALDLSDLEGRAVRLQLWDDVGFRWGTTALEAASVVSVVPVP